MAAAPALVSQLRGHTNTVNNVLFVPNDNAVISASDDRTLRVWIRRTSGDYWPSICQTLEWCVTSMAMDNFHLFVGLESGTINHYKLTEDLNRITLLRVYAAHQMRVSALLYDGSKDWLLSAGKDKAFHWHGESGRRLGTYNGGAWCLCLAFDKMSNIAFVGDYSGVISMITLEPGDKFKLITTLRGHSASVRSLYWDEKNERLISCSADKSIYLWEIGEGKGTAIELSAHSERVNCLVYSKEHSRLLTFAEDKRMIVWNLLTDRKQCALWEESNECQLCKGPFFWNVQKMWQESNMIFKRQHHCRRCGIAVCGDCSNTSSILPLYGFEYPVRMCSTCYKDLSEEELRSSTQKHNILVNVCSADLDPEKKLIAVGCKDNVIRVYDIAACLSM